jgi:hypothetical protein
MPFSFAYVFFQQGKLSLLLDHDGETTINDFKLAVHDQPVDSRPLKRFRAIHASTESSP